MAPACTTCQTESARAPVIKAHIRKPHSAAAFIDANAVQTEIRESHMVEGAVFRVPEFDGAACVGDCLRVGCHGTVGLVLTGGGAERGVVSHRHGHIDPTDGHVLCRMVRRSRDPEEGVDLRDVRVDGLRCDGRIARDIVYGVAVAVPFVLVRTKGFADVFEIVFESGRRPLAARNVEPGAVAHHDLARDGIIGRDGSVLVDPIVAERDDDLPGVAQIGRDVPLVRDEPIGAGEQLSLMVLHVVRIEIALRGIPCVRGTSAVHVEIGKRTHMLGQTRGQTVVTVVGVTPESGQTNAANKAHRLVSVRLQHDPIAVRAKLERFGEIVVTAAQSDSNRLTGTGFADLRNARKRLLQLRHGIDGDGCDGMFLLHGSLLLGFFVDVLNHTGSCAKSRGDMFFCAGIRLGSALS